MGIWFREGLVIALSLTVLCSSIAVAFAVWLVTSFLGPTGRGMASIGGWVVTFAVSTLVYWKITGRYLSK